MSKTSSGKKYNEIISIFTQYLLNNQTAFDETDKM